ncbi:substrate-binding periplasmic protein [Chromobacterium sp. CV08]|uniref:substrate-binding periplasmic protein n=1 Tax=Chromobacterium sp. CV08 TaxID=3133274 RepID=UPI003DA91C16
MYNDATKAGIDKDIANELAKRSGREFQLEYMPRARIWKKLEDGTVMMTGSGIQNDAREKFAWFIPCMQLKNYVIFNKDEPFRSLEQFKASSKMVGVIRSYKHGTAADTEIDALRAQHRVLEVAEQEQLYRMLQTKRLDLIVALPPASMFYLDQFMIRDRVVIADWFPDPPIIHNLVFSRKAFTKEEIAMWKKIVKSMVTDGTLKKIYTKYVGEKYAADMLKFPDPAGN